MHVLTSSSALVGAALVAVSLFACGTPFTSTGDTAATTSIGGATSTATTTTASTTTGTGGTGAGGQATTTGSGGAGGKPTECASPSDCPGADTPCSTRTCVQGMCGVVTPMGPTASQIYGDCKAMVCDGQGHLGEAPAAMDVYDDGNACTTDGCQGTTPKNEASPTSPCDSGICNDKGSCVECLGNDACPFGKKNCVNGKCVPGYCVDNFQDFNETATDCGGASCLPCDDGQTCGTEVDCKSLICNGDPQTCKPATCADLKKNGTETDKDCGGDCADQGKRCQPGQHCARPGDCGSKVCVMGLCQAPTCVDGVKNGGESAPDCGGNGCGPCLPPG